MNLLNLNPPRVSSSHAHLYETMATPEAPCPLQRLPNEVLLLVARPLSLHCLNSLSMSCRRFAALFSESLLRLAVNHTDHQQQTVVTWAARRRRTDLLDKLLYRGASLSGSGYLRKSPLHEIARHPGMVDMVALLIDKGASVDETDIQGESAIHYAVRSGEVACVQLLLERGADINAASEGGETPLTVAAAFGLRPIAEFLLERGADVRKRTRRGATALHLAAEENHEELVKILIDSGGGGGVAEYAYYVPLDIHDEPFRTREGEASEDMVPLFLAAGNGNPAIVQLLFDAGSFATQHSAQGRNALHHCAQSGNADVARLLIEAGTEVGSADESGHTPLHFAASSGNVPVAELLLKAGAVVDCCDTHSDTPLSFAVVSVDQTVRMTMLLVAAGADVDRANVSGLSPWHEMLEWSDGEISMFTSECSDPDVPSLYDLGRRLKTAHGLD